MASGRTDVDGSSAAARRPSTRRWGRWPLALLTTVVAWLASGITSNAAAVEFSSGKRQLVGMIPSMGVMKPQWWDLRWPTDRSAASPADFTARPADLTDGLVAAALGKLADFVFESLPQMSCKLDPGKTKLLCLHRRWETTPLVDSCCGDSLLIIDKATGEHTFLDVYTPIFDALKADGYSDSEAGSGFPTHTFDLTLIDGKLYAIIIARMFEEILTWGSKTDLMVAVSIEDGSYMPTAAGPAAFVLYRDIGTFSSDPSDCIYSIQHLLGGVAEDQWHLNGVHRFSNKDGIQLLAFTQLYTSQAVVMTDPWTSAANEILQRFGTTPVLATDGVTVLSTLYFGLDPATEPSLVGVHNVYYAIHPDGRETITIFVNGQGEELVSKVAEFELSLLPESEANLGDGAPLFPTNYTVATCDYYAPAKGGARPVGDGIYLATSGKSTTFAGLELVGLGGQAVRMDYLLEDEAYIDTTVYGWEPEAGNIWEFYDPFVFFDLSPAVPTEEVRHKLRKNLL